ncbi:hypothetical protein TRIUR3_01804 [Triticum urartu]|uniref:Uncharacterized protein n=1 Tax=Triticum urartu TaxID=4572 RepID=M7YFI8_TRIUA|nr:hypothetical protein TRIUR3_01804 [Triticum urartu]
MGCPAEITAASTTTPSCCWISINLSFPLLDQEGGDVFPTVRVLNAEVPSVRRSVIGDLDHDEYDSIYPVLLNASARDLQGGRRGDRLDVRGIQAEHGLRALFAFKPGVSRRGLRIRPDPATGDSAVPFRDGAAIALDGEPKVQVSWTKPVLMIATGLLVPAVMAVVAFNGVPESLLSSSVVNALFSPWILASAVIVFVRLRMRPQAPPPWSRATVM